MHVSSLLDVINIYVCLFTNTPARLRSAKGKDYISLILNVLQHPAHCPEQPLNKRLFTLIGEMLPPSQVYIMGQFKTPGFYVDRVRKLASGKRLQKSP